MANQCIIELEKKLGEMKKMTPEGFIDEKQASAYFAEKEVLLESIVKTLAEIDSASTTETDGVKEAIKSFRDSLKAQNVQSVQLSIKDVQFQLGKVLVSAWNGNVKTLGELKCSPNLRNENWNNPKDFDWNAEKGFMPTKSALGDPMGNMATNEQYLINPIYEDAMMSDAIKQSVMMPLVTHRPMMGANIFIPEHERGGVVLNWLTAYGEKIQSSKPKGATRKELKAYTLAGYIPFYDEFEEDVFADLGKMFMEEFTESYAREFDKQCLIANADPFTGAFNATGIKSYVIGGATAASVSYLDLRNAVLSVPSEERKDCKWFFNETILNHIANVTDAEGNPIWRRPGDGKPGTVDGYSYYECSLLPQLVDVERNTAFAIFMNPKRICHGNRKGVEIKRFDGTTESLEYGENFMRFRKRDGFLVTRATNNMVVLKTGV